MTNPKWVSPEGKTTIDKIVPEKDLQLAYERVSSTAEKILGIKRIGDDIYDALMLGYIGLATPVLTNFGSQNGLPVSCYSVHPGDSIDSIYSHISELAVMSKEGGGVGVYLGDIRPRGTKISGGGKSNGITAWAKSFDMAAGVVSQGGTRRGSCALYIPIDHPDLEDIFKAKDHSKGDPRLFIDNNIAVTVSDEFMNGLVNGDKKNIELYSKVLRMRLMFGSPYIVYIDNVNKYTSEAYKLNNLKVTTSNLCSEITLFTDPNHSFVCVLSSMNVLKYDEWKDWRSDHHNLSAPQLAIYLLEAVCESFIQRAQSLDTQFFDNAIRSAVKGRALGLGTMGLHAYYQSKMLPFKSKKSRELNEEIHKFIYDESWKASRELATIFGEPEWCKGLGIRHTHLTACAPTRTNSVICNAGSQGIEPIDSNYYGVKQGQYSTSRKNEKLKHILEYYSKDTQQIWDSILDNGGSVQHLEFLSPYEKQVFLTAREIDQFEIISQSVSRQIYIDQAQSINLFVDPDCSPEYLVRLHISGWFHGLKSLYYLRSASPTKFRIKKSKARIITKVDCKWCQQAKEFLNSIGIEYQEEVITTLKGKSFKSVPQVWIDDIYIGGYTNLIESYQAPSIDGSNNLPSECTSCEA